MRAQLRAGRYRSALSAIADYQKWLEADNVRSLQREVYDTWARNLAAETKWSAVVEVYSQALQELPNDEYLSHNAVVFYDQWANTLIRNKDWQAAAKVYRQGLEQFPNHTLLQHNLDYCKQQ